MWIFTIESTLHHELPNKKIQFGIGHGEIGDTENVSVEDDAYSYTSKNDGRKKVITFINPFWYYFVFGIDPNNLKIANHSSMYYASYISIKEKGLSNVSKDEQDLYHKLVGLLNEYEKEMRWYYRPSVEVLIDSKFYILSL